MLARSSRRVRSMTESLRPPDRDVNRLLPHVLLPPDAGPDLASFPANQSSHWNTFRIGRRLLRSLSRASTALAAGEVPAASAIRNTLPFVGEVKVADRHEHDIPRS